MKRNFELEPNRNIFYPVGLTDDAIWGNRFLVSYKPFGKTRLDDVPRIQEPLRSYLHNQNFDFGILTGDSIVQMVRERGVRFETKDGRMKDAGFMADRYFGIEVAFCKKVDGVLLLNTAYMNSADQQLELTKALNAILGISTRIRVRNVTARDAIELDWLYQERFGEHLFNDRSALTVSQYNTRRVCVGRYGGRSRDLLIQATPFVEGSGDVLAMLVLEPKTN